MSSLLYHPSQRIFLHDVGVENAFWTPSHPEILCQNCQLLFTWLIDRTSNCADNCVHWHCCRINKQKIFPTNNVKTYQWNKRQNNVVRNRGTKLYCYLYNSVPLLSLSASLEVTATFRKNSTNHGLFSALWGSIFGSGNKRKDNDIIALVGAKR